MWAKEGSAEAAEQQLALLRKECAARDDQIVALSEKWQAAQLEVKLSGSSLGRKNEDLTRELEASKASLASTQRQLEQSLLAVARHTVGAKDGGGAGGGMGGKRTALSADAALPPVHGGPDTLGFFHNTCLLVKVLVARQQPVRNIPIDELYEDVRKRELPIEEWPQFIYQRYHAQPS